MASGRVPFSLGVPALGFLAGQPRGGPGTIVTLPGPLGLTPILTVPGPLGLTPQAHLAPRLVGLTVTHGARRNATNPGKWDSYLFAGERAIVLAKTDPDHWTTWTQITWNCNGGKPITGFGNGWSIPRSQMGEFRVSASLGGVGAELIISVDTLVDLTGTQGSGGSLGTPINPLGTGKKVNLYGEHETDDKGFEDYAALKLYQAGIGTHVRPLTNAPLNAPPPDGPGLANDCASDICMRATPFHSPSYYAINRLRRKNNRCRITFFINSETIHKMFLDAFPDASHIQQWSNGVNWASVIEYPPEAVWSPASDVPQPVIPIPDRDLASGKVFLYEGQDWT